MTTKKLTPAHAQYAEKDIPPLMVEFAAWLTKETGVPVDARSVYLGSALREKFQKSDGNQKRLAALKKAAQPNPTATAQTKVTTKKPAPQATPKATTVRAAAAKPATRKATPKPTTNNAAALAAGVASGHVQIVKAGA